MKSSASELGLRDNKLNQAFLIYFFYMENLTDGVLWNVQPIFNQNVMDWSLVQTFIKIEIDNL